MVHMKLILLRHGIAEDRDLVKPDHLRELTEEGIWELQENAGFLYLYLQEQEVRLISSPLVRSIQTADILKETGLGTYQAMDFVAGGNIDDLKKLVRTRPDITHVIVGHSPYLEEWVYAITSQHLDMKKGSACLIEITDEETFTGFLTWYLPIDKYDRLIDFGSFRESVTRFRQDIEDIIEKYRQIILEHRGIYLREPQEIESVHKLRVKIRQFRSLVSFFKPFMKKKQYRTIQDTLSAMAQECAYLRELDVLIEEWESRLDDFEEAGLTGEHFLEVLHTERKSEQDRLYEVLEKPAFARDLGEVEAQLFAAIDTGDTMYLDLNELVMDTVQAWHDEIRAGYEAIDTNDLAIIHALRIRAKKMRYVMEVFGLSEAADTKEMHREIKRWQEVLGNITDANRNSDAVMEIAEKYPESPIDEELRIFRDLQEQESRALYQEFFGSGPEAEHEDPIPEQDPPEGGKA